MRKNKTILVTGAAGFIGSNIVERLLKDNYKVIGVDNLSTGKKSNLPEESENFEMFYEDISVKENLDRIFSIHKIDVVFHLAGNASIVTATQDPASDVRNNILTTMNIVSVCIEHKVSRILHASTMVVYGKDNMYKKEESPCVPISTYGITKFAGERYVLNTGCRTDLDFNLNVTAFRMFNVFGPKQDLNNPYQGVVAIFIGNILNNKKIVIHGSGEQTRDFIYIDDVVDAWVNSIDNENTYGEVFNLGSGLDYSLNQILNLLEKNFDRTVEITRETLRQGDISRCVSDSSKLQKALNWKPKTNFESGLKLFIEYSIKNILK